jgi:hypothetical protein
MRRQQIAAKKAKAAKGARSALTEEEIEEDEDDALLTTLAPGGEIEAREAHHTEAQIVCIFLIPTSVKSKILTRSRLPRRRKLPRPAEVSKSAKHTTLKPKLL